MHKERYWVSLGLPGVSFSPRYCRRAIHRGSSVPSSHWLFRLGISRITQDSSVWPLDLHHTEILQNCNKALYNIKQTLKRIQALLWKKIFSIYSPAFLEWTFLQHQTTSKYWDNFCLKWTEGPLAKILLVTFSMCPKMEYIPHIVGWKVSEHHITIMR